jgi:hypothetical protein
LTSRVLLKAEQLHAGSRKHPGWTSLGLLGIEMKKRLAQGEKNFTVEDFLLAGIAGL